MPVRVSAISFLNPAPLLYNFEHEPAASALRERYTVHYTTPASCAAELHGGQADLGLIPVAELTSDLAVVPGCTIASRNEVRSILLLLRGKTDQGLRETLRGIGTIAADRASRSSAAYVRTIFRHFYDADPAMEQEDANPLAMLARHDAALLIGDPALVAREQKAEVDAAIRSQGGSLLWIDVAQLWRQLTGLPWVAAVWAARPEAIAASGLSIAQLVSDLTRSRDEGLRHTDDLVREWLPRLPLSEDTIRTYLTHNIYYFLDPACLAAIRQFRKMAETTGVLPPLPELNLL